MCFIYICYSSTTTAMKSIFFLLVLFSCTLCTVNVSYAQDRGMKPVLVQLDGKPTTLYSNSHALIIGASDYLSGWTQLPGVRTEVNLVKEALGRNGFTVDIVMNPTSEQLYRAFADFITKYGQNVDNRLLFFYAGHGYTLKTNYGEELGYIVPVNAPNPNYDPAGFQNSAMEMAQVEIFARRLQAKHALFIFDACFSGSLFSSTRAIPEIITYKTTLPVRQFITSGSAEEMVPDKSVFADQFVRALDGEADYDRNNYITGSELGEFLQSTVVNYTRNMQHPQYGKIRSPNLDKGDFVFPVSDASTAVIPAVTATTPPPTVAYNTPPPTRDAVSSRKPTPPPSDNAISRQKPAAEPVAVVPDRRPEETKIKKEDLDGFTPMVFVEGGTFMMGSKKGKGDEKPPHFVKLDDFYIGKFEVTQKEWQEIMGSNPSAFEGFLSCPVERVSYIDIQLFIDRLNKKTGKNYRLPTEAEWEYASRGGNKSMNYLYSGGNGADAAGWMKKNSLEKTHPVGSKQPNELGIFDMSGNVIEWCSDWFNGSFYKTRGTHVNPAGPQKGKERAVRGGSFKYDASMLRNTARFDLREEAKYSDVGFRLVLTEK